MILVDVVQSQGKLLGCDAELGHRQPASDVMVFVRCQDVPDLVPLPVTRQCHKKVTCHFASLRSEDLCPAELR